MANTTAAGRESAFSGKAADSSSSGGGNWKIPDEGVHKARLVALVDLGTHERSYEGKEASAKRRVYLVWELLEEKDEGCLIGRDFVFSTHEMSSLRKLAETLRGKKYVEGEEGNSDINYLKMLGYKCQVQITHTKSKDGKKTYANFAGASQAHPDLQVPPCSVDPWSFVLGADDLEAMTEQLDALPRIMGVQVSDYISVSEEMSFLRHRTTPVQQTKKPQPQQQQTQQQQAPEENPDIPW